MQTGTDFPTNGFDATPADDDGLPRVLDLELFEPIDVNGKTYTVLHLEEPTAKMVEMAESELGPSMTVHSLRKYQIALVSQCTHTPRAAIERMRISQLIEAFNFLSRFTAAGPETGAN